jgi:outer membrane protein assembly factor BamB
MPGKKRSGLNNDRRAYGYSYCNKSNTYVCDLLPSVTPYQICSPQPQFGGLYNNQQRRTPIVSSQEGNILWEGQSTSSLVTISTSSPIIANDGTIYIGYLITHDGEPYQPIGEYFTAFHSNGTAKWALRLDGQDINYQASSAIGADGTNYFVVYNYLDNYCHLYAITSSGKKKWRLALTSCYYTSASVTIGSNGEIFVCGYSSSLQTIIYAISEYGYVLSGYPLTIRSDLYGGSVIRDGPAISTNGSTLYVCAYTSPGNNHCILYSINTITKVKNWEFNVDYDGIPQSRPALNSDESVVYFTFNAQFGSQPNSLFAVHTNTGSTKWQYNTTNYNGSYDTFPQDSLAIGSDGTIYCVTNGGIVLDNNNNYGKLVAIDPSTGVEKWRYLFGVISETTGSFVDTSPIIGGDGTIYIGVEIYDVLSSNPGSPTSIYLTMYAITPEGQLKWKKMTTSVNTSGGTVQIKYATSPAIGLDGTLYIGVSHYTDTDAYIGYSKLYAIN